MLKPQRMSRVVFAGTKDQMDKTIETLFNLDILHIEDYHEEHESFSLGKTLKRGTKISEDLITVRSLSKNLDIDKDAEPVNVTKKISTHAISQQLSRDILPLQKKMLGVVERMGALERRLIERQNTKLLLSQLTDFPVPLELYSGLRNLETYVGSMKIDPRADMTTITLDFELFTRPTDRGEFLIALFISKKYSKNAFELLNSKGFSPIEVPLMEGNVAEALTKINTEIAGLERDIEQLRNIQKEHRENYKQSILAGEEYLSNEVEKTDAPLRFATTKNAFIIEGWIPSSKLAMMKLHLSSAVSRGLYLEVLEEKEFETDEKKPPIQLENPEAAKPYEYLIELFSLPSYKEFDPTMVLYLIFPVFFGFMIGDAGYGFALMILAIIMTKVFPSDDAKNIAKIVFIGGIFSIVFGLFIFADAFGVPFHPPHGSDELNWSAMLGVDIPIHSAIHKLGAEGVIEMLVLSIFASFIHLGLGFIIGFTNEIGHNKKHAVAKLAWFMILLGLFMLMMNKASGTLSGGWIGSNILFDSHLYTLVDDPLPIPYGTLCLAGIGAVLLVVTEGPLAVMEILGLIGNMISYSRLAAIGVAKAAVAAAFNVMLLPLFTGGNVGAIIAGCVLLFICHMLVIILGAISSGIQAVRLNYVEFFLKFYTGGGKKFKPFGADKKYTI